MDCILELAAAVKAATRLRKLVAAYYGYAFEYANKDFSLNSAGHNALARLTASQDIDWLLSPPSYGVRQIGSAPGSDMKAFASVHRRRKLSVLEDDTRTHLDRDADFYQTLNPGQTQAVLRRNWGMALAQKTLVWLFPIETGHAFGSAEIADDLRTVARAGQRIFGKDLRRTAEIAVVIDEGSRKFLHPRAVKHPTPHRTSDYYSHDGRLRRRPRMADALVGELIYFQRIALNQCGAPVDYLLLEDVPQCASQYRLFIFLDAFAQSRRLETAVEAIRRAGQSILVAYGAGFIGSGDSDVAGMKVKRTSAGPLLVEFRDFRLEVARRAGESRFGTDHAMEPRFAVDDLQASDLGVYADTEQAAVAVKPLGPAGGKTWFCGSNVLPSGLVAAIASDSGVHLFTEPGDTLFAGCGTLTLHSRTGGEKTIRLPAKADVVDLYTGEVVARHADTFAFPMEAYATRTFLLGDLAELRKDMGWTP
ncbi:MAG: hypothetical protein IJJ33_00365 [Victivallales bacterium]|nr:hypothetical protein [Victivallales bacterium]